MTLHYFAEDGNYGDANGIVIVDTTKWTEADWDKLEEGYEWQKPFIAKTIAAGY